MGSGSVACDGQVHNIWSGISTCSVGNVFGTERFCYTQALAGCSRAANGNLIADVHMPKCDCLIVAPEPCGPFDKKSTANASAILANPADVGAEDITGNCRKPNNGGQCELHVTCAFVSPNAK